MLRSIGEFAGWLGRVGRHCWWSLRRYGRAIWAIRHDRSALLLRFELGFIRTLTSWECKGRPAIYCWSMDQWDFEVSNSIKTTRVLCLFSRREVNSSVTIPRPPQDASLWKYKPGDLVRNLTHYSRENGQRLELGMASAKLITIEETLYGDAPVLIFRFEGVVEKPTVKVEIVNEGDSFLST
jgi:hypothetical protein